MDDFTSLIPFQQDDTLLFQYTIPTISPRLNRPNIHQDLLNHGVASLGSHQENQNEVTIINKKRKRQQKPSNIQGSDNGNTDYKKQKKAVHRDIERQRRQEMATRYASLRTLLPLEYIKGKRSISDHVHEAMNYIKRMEHNIRELEVKRENLRNLMGESNQDKKYLRSPIALIVRLCSEGGTEILIKNDSTDDWFPLSRVFDVFLDEGIAVVSCVCTRVDQKIVCTIQTEASHMTDVDLFFLQEKLTDKMITWKNLEF